MSQQTSNYIENKIIELLDSDIKTTQIQNDTGLQRSLITRLRSGETKLDNVTFKKAMILYKYANSHCK